MVMRWYPRNRTQKQCLRGHRKDLRRSARGVGSRGKRLQCLCSINVMLSACSILVCRAREGRCKSVETLTLQLSPLSSSNSAHERDQKVTQPHPDLPPPPLHPPVSLKRELTREEETYGCNHYLVQSAQLDCNYHSDSVRPAYPPQTML